MIGSETALVDVGVAARALEDESGDDWVVRPFAGGVLVVVVDGIGHGPDAAGAARIAVAALAADPAGEPIGALGRCHAALKGTRGVVASVASLTAGGALTWAGVGNVEGVLVRRRRDQPVKLLTGYGGVLGHHLPALQTATFAVEPGDTLVLATDGIDPAAAAHIDRRASAQANADLVLAAGHKDGDDALVLVARIRSGRT